MNSPNSPPPTPLSPARRARLLTLWTLAALVTVLSLFWWGLKPGEFELMSDAPRMETLTLTTLGEGRLLALGLDHRGRPLASVYDPRRGLWERRARPPWLGVGHSATYLGDGRVFIFGGDGAGRRAMVYHSHLDRYLARTEAPLPRRHHTATMLYDGRILVTGGLHDERDELIPLASMVVYDVQKDAWIPAGLMSAPRVWHTASLLQDGSVLMVGGLTPGRVDMPDRVDRFDPVKWSVTSGAGPAEARADHQAVVLPDGDVLVMGGAISINQATQPLSTVERYDSATGQWRAAAPMRDRRRTFAALTLPQGQVMIIGGWWRANRRGWRHYVWRARQFLFKSAHYGPLRRTELYDPGRDAWSLGPELRRERHNPCAALSMDRVVVSCDMVPFEVAESW